MPLNGYLRFKRDAYLLVTYSFLGWLGGNIVWFVLPFYFRSLGMSYSEIGTMFSISTLTQAALLLFAGSITVKLRYRRSLLLALLLFLTGRGLQVTSTRFEVLAVASAILGFGMALEGPALMSILSEESRDEDRHYLFSLNSAMGTFGAGFGMLLGGVLPGILTGNPYRATLLIAFFFIPLQIFLVFLVSPVVGGEVKEIRFSRGLALRIARFSLPSTLIGLGAGITIPYMGLWFNRRFGTALSSIGGLFALQQFIMGFGTFILPAIADRLGSVKTIVAFNGSASGLIAGMPFLPSFQLAAVVYIIRTILMNIVNPIWDAFMMLFFPGGERPTALAIRNLSWTLTFGIGQYIGGYVFDRSLTIPFLLTGALYGLSMAAFWALFAGEEGPQSSETAKA